jgi:hypothetical protein
MSDDEQRVHARIHISTIVDVVNGRGEKLEAVLRDLSKGGARFVCAQAVGKPGERVQLSLPSLKGADLTVMAEIVRIFKQKEGVTVAVRFDEISAKIRPQLLDLIEVLLSTSTRVGKPRPRAARRMEIRFGELKELRAILSDLKGGTLSMTVESPLVLYEELDLIVPDAVGKALLTLRARVMEQRAIVETGQNTYRIGLEIGPLRPEAICCLEVLSEVVSRITEDVTASSS